MKIYCSKCKCYINNHGPECWAKNNTREQSSWFELTIMPITPANEKNCNNDCTDYLPVDANSEFAYTNFKVTTN